MLAVSLSVSFDPLHLIGIVFCGCIASYLGNLVGLIVVSLFTPTLDGQRFWKILAMIGVAAGMTVPKIIIAFVATIATMALCGDAAEACKWTMLTSGLVGLIFTFFVGRNTRI